MRLPVLYLERDQYCDARPITTMEPGTVVTWFWKGFVQEAPDIRGYIITSSQAFSCVERTTEKERYSLNRSSVPELLGNPFRILHNVFFATI